MYEQLVELNKGRGVNVPGQGLEKIKNMEKVLQKLETQREKEAEVEAEKVQAKIGELSKSIQSIESKKQKEREQNRRTMTIEINDLREQMKKNYRRTQFHKQ